MATTDELLDALMKGYKKPEDLIGENGLLKLFSKKGSVKRFSLFSWQRLFPG